MDWDVNDVITDVCDVGPMDSFFFDPLRHHFHGIFAVYLKPENKTILSRGWNHFLIGRSVGRSVSRKVLFWCFPPLPFRPRQN